MNNKKGFTLVEVLAVIIIIGIIMIIAIPAVYSYIDKTNRGSYASEAQAYVETVASEYTMKEYGDLLEDDELMIVPVQYIELEKGEDKSSPFAPYDFSRCYVIIVPERNNYQYYVSMVDEAGFGIVQKPSNELGRDSVENKVTESILPYEMYASTSSKLTISGRTYVFLSKRDISSVEKNVDDAIILMQEE